MGNIALSAEDIAFLKEKGNNKTSDSDIKNAFKEFKVDPDTEVFIIYVIAFRNDATFVKVLLQSPRIYVDNLLLIDIYLGSMAEIF